MLKNFILRGKILAHLLTTQYKRGIFGKIETPEYVLPRGMKRGSRESNDAKVKNRYRTLLWSSLDIVFLLLNLIEEEVPNGEKALQK